MRSDKNIFVVATLAIHDRQEDALRDLAKEMSDATAIETGTLNYEWHVSEDGKTCRVLERYADSDAVRTHLEAFGAFSRRMTAIADISSLEVHGSPDARVREALEPFGATFYQPCAGFVR